MTWVLVVVLDYETYWTSMSMSISTFIISVSARVEKRS